MHRPIGFFLLQPIGGLNTKDSIAHLFWLESPMPVEFRCGECAAVYDVADDLAGKTIRCRECNIRNQVPAISYTCSYCGARIHAPEKLAGCQTKCPSWQGKGFPASAKTHAR
jgi:DNA-directed RNA polymerase subunit RPC12/RpoP